MDGRLKISKFWLKSRIGTTFLRQTVALAACLLLDHINHPIRDEDHFFGRLAFQPLKHNRISLYQGLHLCCGYREGQLQLGTGFSVDCHRVKFGSFGHILCFKNGVRSPVQTGAGGQTFGRFQQGIKFL